MYLLAINQALPYGCSFVTYGHPEGSAAGDITIITIIWNDVFKQSVDCAHPFQRFIYFLLPSPSHGVLSFLGFENLFAIYIYIYIYIYINKIYFQEIKWRKQFQIQNYLFSYLFIYI